MQSSWASAGRAQSSAFAFVEVFKCEVVLAAGLTSILTLRTCQGLMRIYRFCLYLNKDCLLKSSLIHKEGIVFVFCVTKERWSNMGGGWDLGMMNLLCPPESDTVTDRKCRMWVFCCFFF